MIYSYRLTVYSTRLRCYCAVRVL